MKWRKIAAVGAAIALAAVLAVVLVLRTGAPGGARRVALDFAKAAIARDGQGVVALMPPAFLEAAEGAGYGADALARRAEEGIARQLAAPTEGTPTYEVGKDVAADVAAVQKAYEEAGVSVTVQDARRVPVTIRCREANYLENLWVAAVQMDGAWYLDVSGMNF